MKLKILKILKSISRHFKNQFLGSTVIYGVSTAINKGLVLIALPFLGEILTINEYGIWALIQVIVSLGAPTVSLNGFAALIREGVGNESRGQSIFVKYLKLTGLSAAICVAVALIFLDGWFFYAINLIVLSAFQLILLGWYRSQDRHAKYFLVSFIKLIGFFVGVLLIWDAPSLYELLRYQIISEAVLITLFIVFELFSVKALEKIENLKEVLFFSILLIPNGLAQWVLSGSDRIVIERMLNDFELGKYSLAYSLAMVLMLINSGMGLTIPNHLIKNYENWATGKIKRKIITVYGIVSTIISLAIFCSIPFLKKHIDIFKEIDYNLEITILTILLGLYLLGIYYLYVNFLFYFRKSKTISLVTGITGIFNIFATIYLVEKKGIYGAALATLLSYIIYCGFTMFNAIGVEPRLVKNLAKELSLILLFAGLIIAFSFAPITYNLN